MILLNYAFETSLKKIKFKNQNICNVKLIGNHLCHKNQIIEDEKKFYGFILKIRIFNKTEKFVYLVLNEPLSTFLVNNTEFFATDLNLKNVIVKFGNMVISELQKILNVQLKLQDIRIKITNCSEGSAKINNKFYYIESEHQINSIYSGKLTMFYKIEDSDFLKSNFFINIIPADCKIDFPSLFNASKSDIQMMLNIFLRNGARITNLAEIAYCYPQLKTKIFSNISKNNKNVLIRLLEKFEKEEEPELKINVNVLSSSLNENIMPVIASIIESNNLQINSYLKIKNLNDIFEYYLLKQKFYDKPFEYWLEIIFKSENKSVYESELLKKQYIIGLCDIDELLIRTLFSNLSEKSFENLIEDLKYLKKINSELDVLKSKNKIVSLITEYEITDEMFEKTRLKVIEYFQDTKDGLSVQFITRQLNQQDLFIALKYLNNKSVEQKFLDNFSKNTRNDYLAYNPVSISKYKAYSSIKNIMNKYIDLFENSKLKIEKI
ncbi:hypothetical protein KA977_02110 [Candidatus Dependentiae bacterium]|nr:hypothetical protein [Candidatus Dependentiae bacterium]